MPRNGITDPEPVPAGGDNMKPVNFSHGAVIIDGKTVVGKDKALVPVGDIFCKVFLIDVDDHGADSADGF